MLLVLLSICCYSHESAPEDRAQAEAGGFLEEGRLHEVDQL
jgi:hypothetical protein